MTVSPRYHSVFQEVPFLEVNPADFITHLPSTVIEEYITQSYIHKFDKNRYEITIEN
jgi:hypothetical protein